MDIVAENVEKLKEIFPDVFSEGKIDFEVLEATLGEYVDKEDERYSFTWNGKAQARRIAQTLSTGTLRPAKEESKDWDTTQNLYIEGDNLEVLKLLQKSYHKKVKMIYIDPPYNTGKDFVYKDNFKDNLKNYLEITGQVDSEGNKLSTNSDTSGRYHSDWLNMMYPRLKLARNLLKDDGVIFISIDDNEVTNLRKLCDEIFGEDNFVGEFIWKKKQGGGNDSNVLVVEHEYIVSYTKTINNFKLELDTNYELDDNLYPYKDEIGEYGLITLDKSSIRYSDSLVFEIKDLEGNSYFPRVVKGKQSCWRWGKEKVEKDFDKLVFKNGKVYTKYYRPEGITPKSLLVDTMYGRTETGNDNIKEVFNNQKPFSYPKPLNLIEHFTMIGSKSDDLILDFFSGSATTAHAVMKLNSEDDGSRRYIMVQLPETTEIKSEAYKEGYQNICEIGKERIRRAGELVKKESGNEDIDVGFKVFKLDSSNIKEWDPESKNLEQNLWDSVDNIKTDRSSGDLLYEILLKYGLDLTLPIEELELAGKKVDVIGFGALVVCLDEEVTLDTIEAIAKLKEEYQADDLMRVVFRDNGFKDAEVKTNAIQILKQYGIEDVKSV